MANSTFLWVLSGCLLGTIQLVVGILLGVWLHRKRPAAMHRSHDIAHAERIAHKLQALAGDMSSSVGEHRSQLEEAGRLLADTNLGNDDRLAELVTDVIGDVVGANQRLQSRLESAETRLHEQAKEIAAQMSRALTDALTGLANRREFDERLAANMSSWRKRGETFTLLMLDVDHFKQLNDRFGHVAGDHVLTTVANALRSNLRRTDVVARYGGEEFAMLLPATSLDQALDEAEKTLAAIGAATTAYQGIEFKVTVSGGLATIRGDDDDAELIHRADTALYAAKAAGRNCIFAHDGIRTVSLANFGQRKGKRDFADTTSSNDAVQLNLLLQMIESLASTGENRLGAATSGEARPQHEEVSLHLAEACEELRRCLEDRASGDGPSIANSLANAR